MECLIHLAHLIASAMLAITTAINNYIFLVVVELNAPRLTTAFFCRIRLQLN